MYCRKCGKEISETQKFCPNCGQPQRIDSSPNYEYNDYQTPYAAYPPSSNGCMGPLKADRSFVLYILLGIVTCGIYNLYVLYTMIRDVNIACDGDGENTPGLLQYILLSIVTLGIYSLYFYYKFGNRLWANAPRYKMEFQENGTTILLWMLIGYLICAVGSYVAVYFLIRNTNDICQAYNDYVMKEY